MSADGKNEAKTFTVSIDGDEFEIPKKDLTANLILQIAGLDAALRYLILKVGKNTVSYKDNPDEVIRNLHENMIFSTGSREPVTVS